MARRLGQPIAVPADDPPKPGDFDEIDPEDVEVIARGSALAAGQPFMLTVVVPLELEAFHAIADAAAAEGMDAAEYVQHAVRALGEVLREGKSVPELHFGRTTASGPEATPMIP